MILANQKCIKNLNTILFYEKQHCTKYYDTVIYGKKCITYFKMPANILEVIKMLC